MTAGKSEETTSMDPNVHFVVKSPEDKRLYRVVELSNGLTAVLIHDPDMEDSTQTKPENSEFEKDSEAEGGEVEDHGSVVGEADSDEEEGESSEWETASEDDELDSRRSLISESHGKKVFGIKDNGASSKRKPRFGKMNGKGVKSNAMATEYEVEYDSEDYEDEDDEDDYYDSEDDDSDSEEDEERGHHESMKPTKKAAAAVCVGVGSFSDPEHSQGLAHFLEHMLFMGSKKYPDENDYDDFLSKHGGNSNAFTETEYTCFHFDVSPKFLHPALDRFAQFFIAPLAKVDAMEREVQAVDSEFEQVKQRDDCRLLQLQCSTANEEHPFRKFSWGNASSLSGSNKEKMRENLLKLYTEKYGAGRMKLAVLGGEPLDVLENWVRDIFAHVPAAGRTDIGEEKEVANESPPGGAPQLALWPSGQLWTVDAVADQHEVTLTWQLPCLDSAYQRKPQDYVSHLIGHEGAGSLLALLKRRSWATELSAGVGEGGHERNSSFYLFTVTITLTEQGSHHVLDVVSLVYQYIAMLKRVGPQEWVFEEIKAISEMEFRFAEEEAADDYVVQLATNMRIYPRNHTIYGDYMYAVWDPQLVLETLNLLNPGNMRLDLVTKSFNKSSPDVQVEPWFETPYVVTQIPPETLSQWANPTAFDENLAMPPRNEFIANDFALCSSSRQAHGAASEEATAVPRLVVDSDSLRVWYKEDDVFGTPRANVNFAIWSPEAYRSPENAVLSELFVKLLEMSLTETTYLAHVAKLDSSISASGHHLEIRVWGFSHKLPQLIRKIFDTVKNFQVQDDHFQIAREELSRHYRNANMKPLKHSSYLRLLLLRKDGWRIEDRLAALMEANPTTLESFVATLSRQVQVEMLAHGNLTEEDAVELGRYADTTFPSKGLTEGERPGDSAKELPAGEGLLVAARVVNREEKNSAVEVYFQGPVDSGAESLRERCLMDLLEAVMYEPIYNQLRSKEQLGYRVDCGIRVTFKVLGFCIRVQSAEYSPPHLTARIQAFLGQFRSKLASIESNEFESYREALIADKLQMDHSLGEESDRIWEQITEKRYLFNSLELEAKVLEGKSIQKEDLLEWFDLYVGPDSPGKRSLTVQVWGAETSSDSAIFSEDDVHSTSDSTISSTSIKDVEKATGLKEPFLIVRRVSTYKDSLNTF